VLKTSDFLAIIDVGARLNSSNFLLAIIGVDTLAELSTILALFGVGARVNSLVKDVSGFLSLMIVLDFLKFCSKV